MSVLFIALPAWIGYFWTKILKVTGRCSRLLHAWVLGFATMLAVGHVVLVPLVAMQQTLTTALVCWQAVLTVLALVSFVLWLGNWKRQVQETAAGKYPCGHKSAEGMPVVEKVAQADEAHGRSWTIIFGILVAVLILLQAYIPARYEHRDDDDARFVAEEVSAVVHDTMYQDDPIEAELMYWDTGEVRKDLTSPWAMYVAMCSRISGIPPAVLSHTYLPFFLILLCYAVYMLIGQLLFKNDWEKTFLFLIFLSVLHLWGYTSTHTLASMLLLRIWQGKAVCASFMLPLFFYLMYRIMQQEYEKGWLAFLYVASTGACLLSGIGIVTAPVVLLLYGILDFIYYRRPKKTAAIWMAALPSAVSLLYYLMG